MIKLRIFPKKKLDAKSFRLKWSEENVALCEQAEAAISQANPEKALNILSKMEDPALQDEIAHLNSRLTKYQRQKIRDVLNPGEERVQYNRINSAIVVLIHILRASFDTEATNHKIIFDYLKKRYTNRLEQKLARRQPINLRRLPSTIGTSEETSAAFIPIESGEIQAEIKQTFQDAFGRLLIVGAPGSGKTCLLLQLVLKLLESERFAIPVILNLATWRNSYANLEDWLEEILPLELGANKTFAKKIIQQSDLILLFDGFDEVKEEDRASCLEAIGKYGVEAKRRFVITSRIEEYKAVVKDAPVNLQIEVGPLTYEQVITELESIGHTQPEAKPLVYAIEKDPLLKEVVQTPFYFNVLQLLFAQGKRLSDLKLSAETVEGLQGEIIKRFVDAQIDQKIFGEKPVRKWLAFLAHRMGQRNMVVFELRDLQYDWWRWSKGNRFLGGLVYGLVFFLVFGLVFGLVSSPVLGLTGGLSIFLFLGLVPGLAVGLIFGLVFGLDEGLAFEIETRDRTYVAWKFYWKHVRRETIYGLVFVLAFVLVFVLVYGLVYVLAYSLVPSLVSGLVDGLFFGLPEDLVPDLVVGLFFGLACGLVYLLIEEYSTILQINRPYQRFYASMYSLHFSILQHWLLRHQFYRQGLLPLKLVRFLNEMTRRYILESDGATWRFRHRLIQEYFAGMWEEPEEGKKTGSTENVS